MSGKGIEMIFSRPNETDKIPSIGEFYAVMEPLHSTLLWIASFASSVVFLIAIVQIFYVIEYVKKEQLRSHIYFLIFMPAVTCMCSMIGMFIPRSAEFLYTVNVSYYMLCLYMVITLMFAMFGSKRILVKYLQENAVPIRLAVPPYFSWMTCLPEFESTRRNVTVIESLILQTVIIRMVQQVTEMVVFHELGDRNHVFFSVSNGIGLISMILAFAFVYVMIDLGKERLAPYRYSVMFRLHDAAQSLCSMQKFFVDILVKFDFISRSTSLSASSTGLFYLNFALCIEMLGLSCLAVYLLRPSQTILFESDDNNPEQIQLVGISTSKEQVQFLDQHSEANMKPSPNSSSGLKNIEKTTIESMTTMPASMKTPENTERKKQNYSPLPKSDNNSKQT